MGDRRTGSLQSSMGNALSNCSRSHFRRRSAGVSGSGPATASTPDQRQQIIEMVGQPPEECCSGLSVIAVLLVGLLAPVLDESAQSHLCKRAPACDPSGVPGRDRVRLVRGQDAPMEAVCSARSGVPDDAPRLAFGIDKQFGARAKATPLLCRIRGSARLTGAQVTSKSPKLFSMALWHADAHSPQQGPVLRLGRGPPFTHPRGPCRSSADETRHQSSRRA
jgi:hypothetical protein